MVYPSLLSTASLPKADDVSAYQAGELDGLEAHARL